MNADPFRRALGADHLSIPNINSNMASRRAAGAIENKIPRLCVGITHRIAGFRLLKGIVRHGDPEMPIHPGHEPRAVAAVCQTEAVPHIRMTEELSRVADNF